MPNTIPDLAWYVSTGLTVTLMSVIAGLLGWGFWLLTTKLQRITDIMDKFSERLALGEQRIVHIDEKLRSHEVLDNERHKRIDHELAKLDT